jgi:hypothetical protein
LLTQEELKSILHYNPNTGVFIWRKQLSNRIRVGEVAGKTGPKGYLSIGIYGQRYLVQRLAFLYMKGTFPVYIIDHIDTNRANNSWNNLREATQQSNTYNSNLRKDNTSRVKGVYPLSNGRFQVKLNSNKITKYLGTFEDIELAELVAIEARNKYHGEFANHG